MRRHSAPFRLLSISGKQSARYCASADKLGNGAGNGFGLLQQQKVPRTRQVDNPDALAELLAERVAVARRSHFIIEPLDREKGGIAATPPLFEGHVPTGRKMRDKDRRPAFDPFEYLRIGCGREPASPQNSYAIATVHLGLLRIAKGRTDRCRRSDKTAGRKQGHAANQWRLIDCEAPGDPVAEGMSDQVRWTTADCLDDARNVTGQIVQGCAVERAATACNTAHINRDGLKPSGCKHASQIIKIILLRHEFDREYLALMAPQQGHRGIVLTSAFIRRARM